MLSSTRVESRPYGMWMRHQVIRYALVGLLATAMHYVALSFAMEVLDFASAGAANALAAVVGIFFSFLGNRSFVFNSRRQGIGLQGLKFGTLYALIAVVHGAILYVWTDRMGFDYRIGFLLATSVQFVLSFLGNKTIVFR